MKVFFFLKFHYLAPNMTDLNLNLILYKIIIYFFLNGIPRVKDSDASEGDDDCKIKGKYKAIGKCQHEEKVRG